MTLLTSRARGGRSVSSRPSVSALAPWALTLVALGLGLLSLASAKESAIGPYGLIQALPPGYFVSLVILVAAFIMTWTSHETRYPQFITETLVLVILLHGAPGIIESEPRFHEAWTHAASRTTWHTRAECSPTSMRDLAGRPFLLEWPF